MCLSLSFFTFLFILCYFNYIGLTYIWKHVGKIVTLMLKRHLSRTLLVCFCNEHTHCVRKYNQVRIQKKHSKINLMRSFTCIMCINVSPTLSPDRIKSHLPSRDPKAPCEVVSIVLPRTPALKYAGCLCASSAQASASGWRISLHVSSRESLGLPSGPNQVLLALWNLSRKLRPRVFLPCPGAIEFY